MVDNEKRVDQR